MKILNIIVLLGLTTSPIVGCSKKSNEPTEQKEEDNKDKIYNFEIKDLQKVSFQFYTNTNIIFEIKIDKKDNSNLNEQLPELKSLTSLYFQFTKEFENNQSKQDEIRQLITTHGTKTEENEKIWVINKKITIKAQGTRLVEYKHNDNKILYELNKTNNLEIEIENS